MYLQQQLAARPHGRIALWAAAALLMAFALVLPTVVSLFAEGQVSNDTTLALVWGRGFFSLAGLLFAAAVLSPRAMAALLSKGFVFAIPFLSLLAFASFKYTAGVQNERYLQAVAEDGPIEYAGALAEFVAAGLLIWAASRSWRSLTKLGAVMLVCIAAGTLLMGLEEINYGQRILGFDTPPQLEAENYQGSFNLHNRYDMVWLADEFAPDVITYWGLLGWIAAAVAQYAPILPARLKLAARLATPALYITSFFLPFAIWANLDVCCESRVITISEDQEPAESYLGFAFLAYSLDTLRRVRREHAAARQG